MKKIIIFFIVGAICMLSLIIFEGFYILRCRNQISQLRDMNKNLISLNFELENSNRDLKDKNLDLLAIQEEKHPISIRLQECMKKQNYTTAGMNRCTYAATDEWYKEIDTNILLLKNYMTTQQYNLLIESQNKWKSYEKVERELLDETIGSFVGTMYTNVLAGEKNYLVETRAKNLSGLYYYMSDKDIMKN